MIQHWLKKINSTLVTFKFSILFIFITLFITSIFLLIVITYYRFSIEMSYYSLRLMKDISGGVYRRVSGEIDAAKIGTQSSVGLMNTGVVNSSNLIQVSGMIENVMQIKSEILPSVHSAFWGNEAGDFVISAKAGDDQVISQIKYFGRLPKKSSVLPNDTQNTHYDPRLRPWYQAAKAAKKTIVTDLFHYTFFGTHFWGITVATPAYDKQGRLLGVFGLQMRLDALRKFIESLQVSQHGKIFIVTDDGVLIVFPKLKQFEGSLLTDLPDTSAPWIIQSFLTYQKNLAPQFSFRYQHHLYIASYRAMLKFGAHSWLIGVVAPEEDFVETLIETNYITLGMSLIILLLGIALVSRLVNRVVNPLKKLAKETENIKNFELGNDIEIDSHIEEVILLTESINSMKKGLRSFQKYVPAALVRQIIAAGEDANIGGAKKKVAILFTEIKNFTSIAEQEEPNVLMAHLCDYFDEVSQVILEEKGTIDKYVSDSVMALWGAPVPESEPCLHAANAALKAIQRVEKLNIQWAMRGVTPLETRIGIHLGDAIIGNVGSSTRLNYTAIGDAINIASRLQSINKLYGTSIIVSNVVYQSIRDQFIFRMIDRVAVKGRVDADNIYELLAKERHELKFDIETYGQLYAAAFAQYQQQQWDAAIEIFRKCLTCYPGDSVARVFIERCENFKLNRPGDEWDGVWRVGNH